MKKHFLQILVILLILCLSICSLASCEKAESENAAEQTPANEQGTSGAQTPPIEQEIPGEQTPPTEQETPGGQGHSEEEAGGEKTPSGGQEQHGDPSGDDPSKSTPSDDNDPSKGDPSGDNDPSKDDPSDDNDPSKAPSGGDDPAPAETAEGLWTGASATWLPVGTGSEDALTATVALRADGSGFLVVKMDEAGEEGTAVYLAAELAGDGKTYTAEASRVAENGLFTRAYCKVTYEGGALHVSLGGLLPQTADVTFTKKQALPAAIEPRGTLFSVCEEGDFSYKFDFDSRTLFTNGAFSGGADVPVTDASFFAAGGYLAVCVPRGEGAAAYFIVYEKNGAYFMTPSGGEAGYPLSEERPTPEYLLTFDLGGCGDLPYAGGSPVPLPLAANAQNGYSVLLPEAPVWEGYAFLHWEIAGEAVAAGSLYRLDADACATAVWEPLPVYEIAFDLGAHAADGVAVSPQRGYAGARLTLPSPAAKTGYAFDGWLDGATSYNGGDDYTISGSATLTARWRAVAYTLTFVPGEGDFAEGAPQPAAVTLESPEAPLPALFRTGYTFLGWIWEGNGTPEREKFTLTAAYISALAEGSETFTLTAVWQKKSVEPVEYTLKFYENSDCLKELCTKTVRVADGAPFSAEDLSVAAVPIPGHAFDGWRYRDGANEIRVNETFVPSAYRKSEFIFYAAWSFHVEIGTPDFSLSSVDVPLYTDTVSRGQCLTLRGKMTSRAEDFCQTALVFLFSNEFWGHFRMDSYIESPDNFNDLFGGSSGPATLLGMNWDIEKREELAWDTFLGVIRSCEFTLAVDWTDANAIYVIFQAVGETGAAQKMTYRITASAGYELADSYFVGVGGQDSYTVFTQRDLGSAPFGRSAIGSNVHMSVYAAALAPSPVPGRLSVETEPNAIVDARGYTNPPPARFVKATRRIFP